MNSTFTFTGETQEREFESEAGRWNFTMRTGERFECFSNESGEWAAARGGRWTWFSEEEFRANFAQA